MQEEKPYGRKFATALHQVVSKSDSCDALGRRSKKPQQINSGDPSEVSSGIPERRPKRGGSKDDVKYDDPAFRKMPEIMLTDP